ncbi:MAG: NAD(P)/FAD-dependent oxidoreductase [Chloroflexota bacterium]
MAIMGGGPAGSACALALLQGAAARQIDLRVIVFEPKDFRTQRNVCAGVLSPPFGSLLTGLGLALPERLVQRRIDAYELHTDDARLLLANQANSGDATLATDRADLDLFLLSSAEAAGAEVKAQAVTDVRFLDGHVEVLAAEGEVVHCDVLVGACGLARTSLSVLEGRTAYRRPSAMRSLLIDVPLPDEEIDDRIGHRIHALLLASHPGVEFAALTPKRGHVTVNVAGPNIGPAHLDSAVAHFQRLGLLPARLPDAQRHGGAFPASPARGIFGERMVTIGNTSGLLRPLKGKGINAGLLTGWRAAQTMLNMGISRAAFAHYYSSCQDITSDYSYGLLLRQLYRISSRLGALDPVLGLASRNAVLQRAFYNMVSGEGSYREVVLSLLRPLLWLEIAGAVSRQALRRALSVAFGRG